MAIDLLDKENAKVPLEDDTVAETMQEAKALRIYAQEAMVDVPLDDGEARSAVSSVMTATDVYAQQHSPLSSVSAAQGSRRVLVSCHAVTCGRERTRARIRPAQHSHSQPSAQYSPCARPERPERRAAAATASSSAQRAGGADSGPRTGHRAVPPAAAAEVRPAPR
eukprot:7378500-Prymnesium_polylepis.2